MSHSTDVNSLEIGREKGRYITAQALQAPLAWNQRPLAEKGSNKNIRKQFEKASSPNNWKPITLQYPVLLSFAITSLSFASILEVLYYFSQGDNGGGLAFGRTADQISTKTSILYLYLPTVLAVLYSILWSWIDLDTKRLEPWFQLSSLDGATAENSLLLHYPFEFLAFVPIRALFRRHWAVFLAGFATVLIFWIITPLQSAIFNIGTVTRTKNAQFITTGAVVPIGSQIIELNANFMNTAYGIAWLGQKLPGYTTEHYALAPYAPIERNPDALSTETWIADTVAYSTQLDCKPAKASFVNSTSSYIFSNENGCITQEINLPGVEIAAPFMTLYIQYWDNAEDDWALMGPNCSVAQSHNFLALAAGIASAVPNNQSGVYNNLTALFCQPSYFEVNVSAEVNATDQSVLYSNFSTTSTTVNLRDDFFNITNFEYIIGTGISPSTSRQDIQNVKVLEQYPRVWRYGLTWPVSNMVGFAVAANAANDNSIQDLSDPLVLHDVFEKAHKLLFSTAISTLTQFSTNGNPYEIRNGTIKDVPVAITYTREFAIIVEASLCVVAFIACNLWIYSFCRPSKLKSDPAASIANLMLLVRNNKDVPDLFQDDGTLTEEELQLRICQKRFFLGSTQSGEEVTLTVRNNESSTSTEEETLKNQKMASDKASKTSKMIRPIEMSLGVGFAFVTLIVGSTCLLTILYIRANQDNGLALPSTKKLVLSFLENALPTALASILEPLWVVLNRLLCVLQPFEDLRIGTASASRTIRSQYTTLPPQLVFWRALKSRHLILAAVCAVAILSNVLAVTLGGLFNESPTLVTATAALPQTLSETFNGSTNIMYAGTDRPISYLDHFYVTLSNLTDGTSLPPWTDHRMFYLPFETSMTPDQDISATSSGISNISSFAGNVRGFGIVAHCHSSENGASNKTATLDLAADESTVTITVLQTQPGGNITTLDQQTIWITELTNDASANEVSIALVNNTVIVLGWVRIGPAQSNISSTTANKTSNRSFEYTSILCSPQLVNAQFDIMVDTDGHILTSNQTTSFNQDSTVYSNTNETFPIVSQINYLISPGGEQIWHNDLFTSDWTNSVIKALLNSTDFLDPRKPPPNTTQMITVFEDVYQRLAAVILGVTPNVFNSPSPSATTTTTVSVIQTKIFMSPVLFQISISILALHLLTAIAYYTHRPKRFLPRMPTTIANLLAYVSMSHAIEDERAVLVEEDITLVTEGKTLAGYRHLTNVTPAQKRPSGRREKEPRYGYGHFIGVDGKLHVGIERSSRIIISDKISSPEGFRRRRRGWGISAWLRGQERKDMETWI